MPRKKIVPISEKPRDAYGRPVPDRLDDAFRGREEMVNLAGRIEELKAHVLTVREEQCAIDVDMDEIVSHLETARVRLLQAIPMEPCDCLLSDDCEKCRGFGWVSAKSLLGQRRLSRGELLASQPPDSCLPHKKQSHASRLGNLQLRRSALWPQRRQEYYPVLESVFPAGSSDTNGEPGSTSSANHSP